MRPVTPFLLSLAAATIPRAAAQDGDSGTVWVTPHDSYSSSVGVLGCKVDTNRVAYWPGAVDCDKICVALSYGDRTVKLLRVDQSQGAYDVSYDAWNYLYTGASAADAPTAGGAVAMTFENVDASECKGLIDTDGHKLPLSAANSMNFLASCLAQEEGGGSSWVAENYILFNILDPLCSWGHDEKCTLDWPDANQASCPSGLGDPAALDSDPVYNIRYPSGETVVASTGEVVDKQNGGSRLIVAPASLDALAFLVLVTTSSVYVSMNIY
ncbi:hypothetical protein F4778DRAFT_712165 [Xylariomycetidae sp. FL2044]|nr:hypothetical protein F4778DRAFT_712165 [Xylariomycetidae sp. FL2044]